MEEQVGMMEYNEKYKQSIYEEDELYEDSKMMPSKDAIVVRQKDEDPLQNELK